MFDIASDANVERQSESVDSAVLNWVNIVISALSLSVMRAIVQLSGMAGTRRPFGILNGFQSSSIRRQRVCKGFTKNGEDWDVVIPCCADLAYSLLSRRCISGLMSYAVAVDHIELNFR